MLLKLQRSQRESGLLGKSVVFCLDARVEFSADEAANIRRYKLQNQLIYSSEAAQRAAAGSAVAASSARAGSIGIGSVDDLLTSTASKMGHGLKAAALGALASMKLTITINSLERGQHIECKSLDELLGAEEAIMDACRSLKGYLEAAATFDGREVLVDFSTEEPAIVATAPAPMLVAPTASPAPAVLQPAPALAAKAAVDPSTNAKDDVASSQAVGFGAQEMDPEAIMRAWRTLNGEQRFGLVIVAGIILIIFIVAVF